MLRVYHIFEMREVETGTSVDLTRVLVSIHGPIWELSCDNVCDYLEGIQNPIHKV